MAPRATVAIPVRDAGPHLGRLLDAIGAQQLRAGEELEVLVCDSGSRDGSAELARRRGATVIEIAPGEFGHGTTRNLLMRHARADHVAFVTQDVLPGDARWLERLLSAFELAPDVALSFGPYTPRPGASLMVARELTAFFASLSAPRTPRLDRLAAAERELSPLGLLGPRGYFTDANGCVARWAWERVPFPEVAYAEDHALAHGMLRAGFAKVFVPEATVIHSHEYSPWGWLQRSFDEARAVHEIYGWREPLNVRTAALNVWGKVGADWRWRAAHNPPHDPALAPLAALSRSTLHHLARVAGATLGGRADRLPAALVRRLSHERRR